MDEVSQHFSSIADSWNKKAWARDKQFAKDIVNFVNFVDNKTFLYVGIGTGELLKFFKASEAFGMDICEEMLEKCTNIKRTHLINGDVNRIPFLDNTFDCVFSRNLLKHVEDPVEAIAEMKRVARPFGRIFVIESSVLVAEDKEYPNYCVRTMEPNHNSFQTHNEIIEFFKVNKLQVRDKIYKYKAKWLDKWIVSSGANNIIRKKIIKKYENASYGFKKRQDIKIKDNNIESIIYWSFVEGTLNE